MKTSTLLLSLICSLATVPCVRAAEAGHHHEEQTELGEHMEKLGSAYKRLGRQIDDATKNEDSLKLVATIRTNAEAALKLEPAKTADLPADQREKFIAAYHEKMHGFLADLAKLEAALKAGKNDEAKQLLATLKQDQKDGHSEFQKKEKRG